MHTYLISVLGPEHGPLRVHAKNKNEALAIASNLLLVCTREKKAVTNHHPAPTEKEPRYEPPPGPV